ncbi:MAG: hypothetical protein M3R35_00655, partial [Candidatus Eremiobacteraeota bacterium]|nr:hypothetical protein [Candidatus Eremiobacteraeota bacterium]
PATTAQVAPKHRGFSLGNVVGAIAAGRSPVAAAADEAAGNALANAMGNALGGLIGPMNAFSQFMQNGKVNRYTYYRGWERIDDTAAQTATIAKYDRHEYITLDLAKKTYRVSDPDRPLAPTESGSAPSSPQQEAPPQPPGTAVLDFTRAGTILGAQTIDGIAATGYDETVGMSVTRASGSCRNGSFALTTTEYVSSIKQPQIKEPQVGVPHSLQARVPMDPRAMVSRGGCRPTITAHSSGASAPSGRLLMYSRLSAAPSNGDRGQSSFSFVTERGNVKFPSERDAAALFAIPAGFTRVP